MNIYIAAKYPFLKEAKEFVRREGVSTQEILHDPLYQRARDLGMQRVNEAIERGMVGNYVIADETDALMTIFSYPIARMIVAGIGSDFLRGRYALAEAKRAYFNLIKEDNDFVFNMAKEFDINVTDELKIYFTDYLKKCPDMEREMETGQHALKKWMGWIEKSRAGKVATGKFEKQALQRAS